MAPAITRYFEIALYLLVLTGFVTLVSSRGLDLPSTSFVAAALLYRGYLLARRQTLLIPLSWTNPITLAYMMFAVVDYLVLSRQFVATTVHLVLFLMVLRLFSARRDRDNYFLAIIAFLMVLAAAVLTVDSIFLLCFAVFLLTAVALAILMEMKRTASSTKVQARELDGLNNRKMALSLARVAPTLLVLILLAGGAIFFVLPRMSTGYLSAFAMGGRVATGFSDHVELGSIGEIQQSSAVVMHIEIEGDTRGIYGQKWRGVALSVFDGKSWANPYRPQPVRPSYNQTFDIRPRNERQRTALTVFDSPHLHYHVLMEPVGVNVFFLAPKSQALQGGYRTIGSDAGGAVYNLDPDRAIGIYDAWSLQGIQADFSPPEQYLGYVPPYYLQLPRLDPRIPQLAKQITADAGSDYDKAIAIRNYLTTQYSYTLQLPDTRPADPLAFFLFDRKRGHCEYFASAMAVMLRTLFIPSRVVTGFQTGEFNDVTSQYIVRAKDAHAWVEAYFPDRGWVTFDPTPPSASTTATGWGRIAMYMDAMATFWREWVVNYDAAHQSSLGQAAAQTGRRWIEQAKIWSRMRYEQLLGRMRGMANTVSDSPQRSIVGGVVGALALLLLFNLRQLVKIFSNLRLAARPEKSPRMAASLWYERMTRKVGRRGWNKVATQTPSEFAGSIAESPLRERVVEFTRHYEGARFGDSAEDAQRLPELYEEVVNAGKD
jgi:protein-glutamine gamma-glutamyltransferase